MEVIDSCYKCSSVENLRFAQGRKNKKKKNLLICKKCYKEYYTNRKLKKLEQNGGATRVRNKPNHYEDEFQKKATFELLNSMGWKFNEQNQIWYKDGIKDSNGNWLNLKTFKKTYSKERLQEIFDYYVSINFHKTKTARYFHMGLRTLNNLLEEYILTTNNGESR